MPAQRRTPSDRELERYLERGLTHREIAEDWNRRTHMDVRPKSISAAISRAGLATDRPRHSRTLPWKVRDVPGFRHARTRHAQMLRALDRRMNGEDMDPKLARKLEAWLRALKAADAVIAYVPTDPRGFRVVDRSTVPPERLDPEVPIVLGEITGRRVRDEFIATEARRRRAAEGQRDQPGAAAG